MLDALMVQQPVSFHLRQEGIDLTPAEFPDTAEILVQVSPHFVTMSGSDVEHGEDGIFCHIEPFGIF